MLCEICGKKVQTKRTIFNLFEPEIHHICEYCYMKNPLVVKYWVIPIEEGHIDHYHLLSNHLTVNGMAYMSFLKPYYLNYLNDYQGSIIYYSDTIDDDLLVILDSLKLGNIYLLTLYENIDKREKNYEI